MSTFVIINTQGSIEELGKKITTEFANKSFKLPKGEWLISYDGTSRQLSDHLGISDDKTSSSIVLNIDGYWGRSSNTIWEWFKVNGV